MVKERIAMNENENTKATSREKLEFEISNAHPLVGTFNGHNINVHRIRLSEIQDAWSEVITIIQSYNINQQLAIRSIGSGGSDADQAPSATDEGAMFFENLKAIGPSAVNTLHSFIKCASDITDDMLKGADFWSLAELTVIILEHNIGAELRNFFNRGGKALATVGLISEEQDLKENKSSSNEAGELKTSEISDPVKSNAD